MATAERKLARGTAGLLTFAIIGRVDLANDLQAIGPLGEELAQTQWFRQRDAGGGYRYDQERGVDETRRQSDEGIGARD